MSDFHRPKRGRDEHPYQGLWEPLEADPGFELRHMFGGRAAYLDGRLMLHFTAKDEPWRGVLVATDRERQPALIAEFPVLAPHPVLPKWLYLAEDCEVFERVAAGLVRLAKARDPRMGVESDRRRKARRGAEAQRFRADKVSVRSPKKPGSETWVDAASYECVKSAIEPHLPTKGAGVTLVELRAAVRPMLRRERLKGRGTVESWVERVLLDLEVRGGVRRRKAVTPPRWLRRA